MKSFAELRQHIEAHEAQLCAVADDPAAFARELAALKEYWQRDDDPDLLAAETERVLRKYPAVWAQVASSTPAPSSHLRHLFPRPDDRKEYP